MGELPPFHPRRLNRFALPGMHRGAVEESCRNIDDGKVRGHNLTSASIATHLPADLEQVGAFGREVADNAAEEPIAGFPSDFKSAFRQATADPGQALDFVVAPWDPESSVGFSFLLSRGCLRVAMPPQLYKDC